MLNAQIGLWSSMQKEKKVRAGMQFPFIYKNSLDWIS